MLCKGSGQRPLTSPVSRCHHWLEQGIQPVSCSSFLITLAAVLLVPSSVFSQGKNQADEYEKPSIGAAAVSLTDAEVAFKDNDMRLPTDDGVLLFNVLAYSPAGLAGLTGMDVVTRVDRTSVSNVEEYNAAIAALPLGKSCEIAGFRGKISPSGRVSWKRGAVKLKPVTRREMLMNAMSIEKDDIKNIEIYRHKDSPSTPNSKTDLHCYIIKSDDTTDLYLRVQYVGKSWVFFNKVAIKADDNVFSIDDSDFVNEGSDVQNGGVWERKDAPVTGGTRKAIDAMTTATEVTVRLEGPEYQRDLQIPAEHRIRLLAVMEVHKMLSKK